MYGNETYNEARAMISQPMRDLTDEEIEATRKKAIAALEKDGYVVLDTWFKDGVDMDLYTVNPAVAYLAASLREMAKANVVYFCKGWEANRGCVIEHEVAKQYGIKIIEEGAPAMAETAGAV